ncbi:hypothetical protein FA15DRAFT_554663, partial [Coprinopsis marcescibilis]
MNTVNQSTGLSPFQVWLGRSPCLIPPLVTPPLGSLALELNAHEVVQLHELLVMEAQDNLLAAKVNQAFYANKHRGKEVIFNVGDLVMLSTKNRRRDYLSKGDKRTAK